jgi:uncharacterized membrane protein
MPRSTMIKIVGRVGWVVVILLSLVALLSIVLRFIATCYVLAGSPIPEMSGEFDHRYEMHPWLTLLHLIGGFLFMVLGPMQFMPSIRNRWRRFHRVCGRIYIVSALLAGVVALTFVPVLPVFGTFTAKVAVLYGGLLFLFSIIRAYVHIRRREIRQHREWMIRGYALGLGIATFRVLFAILMSPLFALSFTEAWDTVVWLGFAINLLVAEIWINVTRVPVPAHVRVDSPKPSEMVAKVVVSDSV